MKEQTWKRKEYETWEDAFMGLSPVVRQQSVRIAAYTRVLFIQACEASFGSGYPGGSQRMNSKYADLAYKCGMYHQLGKALVPEEYQVWQNDFSQEEQAVYKKYPADGRLLVASLQERTLRAREKRTGKDREYHTDNIPWMMIRESCGQHMERYDGSGYPNGILGDQISPIAQIVGLAKELDRISAETKSENPFAEAYDILCSQAGQAFSEELIEILKSARAKCRNVYNKYISYTMTLPKTVSLVDKHKDRPMGLSYRAMTNGEENGVTAYEAEMWFGGIPERPGEKENAAEIEELLGRMEMVQDMSLYFLYEAADTLLRIQNCKIKLDFILLSMLPSFYKGGSQLPRLNQLFKDQPIQKERLVLSIPQQVVKEANKGTEGVIKKYLKNGICLMVDDWDPAVLSLDVLKEYGFHHVRPAKELYMKPEIASLFMTLSEAGITVIAGGADSPSVVRWLFACGVTHMSGVLTGCAVTEDELIHDSLLRERENG